MVEDVNIYQAPSVELLEAAVEIGFSASNLSEIEIPSTGAQDQAGEVFGWD